MTVHSPLYFREIIEMKCILALTVAILIFKCTEEAGVADYSCRGRGGKKNRGTEITAAHSSQLAFLERVATQAFHWSFRGVIKSGGPGILPGY